MVNLIRKILEKGENILKFLARKNVIVRNYQLELARNEVLSWVLSSRCKPNCGFCAVACHASAHTLLFNCVKLCPCHPLRSTHLYPLTAPSPMEPLLKGIPTFLSVLHSYGPHPSLGPENWIFTLDKKYMVGPQKSGFPGILHGIIFQLFWV